MVPHKACGLHSTPFRIYVSSPSQEREVGREAMRSLTLLNRFFFFFFFFGHHSYGDRNDLPCALASDDLSVRFHVAKKITIGGDAVVSRFCAQNAQRDSGRRAPLSLSARKGRGATEPRSDFDRSSLTHIYLMACQNYDIKCLLSTRRLRSKI